MDGRPIRGKGRGALHASHLRYPDEVRDWLDAARRRLADDDDSIADVDLIHGLYAALTGDVLPHPYDEDAS
jgi:hypothetical protein